MDAIMLCMKKRGIRFFSKIKFPNTDVVTFHKKENFLGLLHRRKELSDNVLIMAHGAEHCILTTTNDPSSPFKAYITLDEICAFKNNFVFAVSCSTASIFGYRCVDEGAVAYLGYEVLIAKLFSSYPGERSCIPKRISTAVDVIVKHIFIEALSHAYEKFLTKPVTVQQLKEMFSLLLEKKIAELLDLDTTRLFSEHGIKITNRDRVNYFVKITLQVLSDLNEIDQRLVCIGNSGYISPSHINYR